MGSEDAGADFSVQGMMENVGVCECARARVCV